MNYFKQFIAWADLFGYLDADPRTLPGCLYGLYIVVNFVDGDVEGASGGTSDEHLITHRESVGFNGELSSTFHAHPFPKGHSPFRKKS